MESSCPFCGPGVPTEQVAEGLRCGRCHTVLVPVWHQPAAAPAAPASPATPGAPGPAPPPRPMGRLDRAGPGCLLGVVLFVSLMLGTCGAAVAPVTLRLAAPVLCPSGYDHSVVVLTRGTSRGRSVTNGQLHCIERDGRPVRVASGTALAVLSAQYAVALLVLCWLPAVLVRLRRRRSLALLLLLVPTLAGWLRGAMASDELAERAANGFHRDPVCTPAERTRSPASTGRSVATAKDRPGVSRIAPSVG